MTELAPITGADGVVYQPVLVAQSRPFAIACLQEWKRRDGKDRIRDGWLRRKAIAVPADIVPVARAALEAKRAG